MGLNDIEGIPNTDKETTSQDTESPGWLLSQVMKDKSEREIAKEAGYSRSKVNRLLNEYGIQRDRVTTYQVGMNTDEYPILIGGVLGDASISSRSERGARYRHDDTYKEYLEYLKNQCGEVFEGREVKKSSSQDIYYLNSKTCADMYWMKQVLYYEGEKVFPHLRELHPDTLKHWYIGDGTLREDKYPTISCRWIGIPGVMAAVRCLEDTLDTDGVEVRGPYPRDDGVDIEIAFNGGARDKFFDYIGECPVDCYRYKWL